MHLHDNITPGELAASSLLTHILWSIHVHHMLHRRRMCQMVNLLLIVLFAASGCSCWWMQLAAWNGNTEINRESHSNTTAPMQRSGRSRQSQQHPLVSLSMPPTLRGPNPLLFQEDAWSLRPSRQAHSRGRATGGKDFGGPLHGS